MTERFKKTNRPEPAWHCWLVSRLKTSFLPETQLVGSAAAMNIILCKSYILILKVRLTQQNEKCRSQNHASGGQCVSNDPLPMIEISYVPMIVDRVNVSSCRIRSCRYSGKIIE